MEVIPRDAGFDLVKKDLLPGLLLGIGLLVIHKTQLEEGRPSVSSLRG